MKSLLPVFLLTCFVSKAFTSPLLIENSTSPDGRYAVAWGMEGVDPASIDPARLDPDRVENYLIDLESGTPISTLTTTYFATTDFEKNHHSLILSWRSDSRALVAIETAKWGMAQAELVYVTAPDHPYDRCSDIIPLTRSFEKVALDQMRSDRPDLSEMIEDYVVTVYPILPFWDQSIELNIVAESPSLPEADVFEKAITVILPGPDLVSIAPLEFEGSVAAANLITSNSAGPVRIGMTIGEVRTAFPEATLERTSDGEGIAYVAVVENEEILLEMTTEQYDTEAPILDSEAVTMITVRHSKFATADGVRIGSDLTEVYSKLGPVREILISEIEAREYASFARQPSGLQFQVWNETNTAGIYEVNEYTTKQFREGSSIASISVTGPFIMQDGSIGGIRLDDPAEKVLAVARELGLGPVDKGEDEIWEAFGQAVQSWNFPEAGVSFDMISDEIGGEKEVFSITLDAPSILGTGAGIQIGDDKSDVEDAYKAYETNTEDFDDYFGEEDVHLIGSIYGGMIFTFEEGKLRRIFLGAASE